MKCFHIVYRSCRYVCCRDPLNPPVPFIQRRAQNTHPHPPILQQTRVTTLIDCPISTSHEEPPLLLFPRPTPVGVCPLLLAAVLGRDEEGLAALPLPPEVVGLRDTPVPEVLGRFGLLLRDNAVSQLIDHGGETQTNPSQGIDGKRDDHGLPLHSAPCEKAHPHANKHTQPGNSSIPYR